MLSPTRRDGARTFYFDIDLGISLGERLRAVQEQGALALISVVRAAGPGYSDPGLCCFRHRMCDLVQALRLYERVPAQTGSVIDWMCLVASSIIT